ncbi:MAG: hypothetical protein R6V58_18330 [Planctomycetota bacterium]
MQSPEDSQAALSNPPEASPTDGSGKTPLSVETSESYVSPAYVVGEKPATAYDVEWRYKDEENWHSVSKTAAAGTGVCADTWWWTEIDLHRADDDDPPETQYDEQGRQMSSLTKDDRTVEIVVRCINAAGASEEVSHEIEWKIAVIGEERTETRYKTVDGERVPYEVSGLTDHLIQEGEKMILGVEKNTYEDPQPDSVRMQIWRYDVKNPHNIPENPDRDWKEDPNGDFNDLDDEGVLPAVPSDEQSAQFDQPVQLLRVARRTDGLDHAVAVGLVDHLDADRAGSVGLPAYKHGPQSTAGHPNRESPPWEIRTYDGNSERR